MARLIAPCQRPGLGLASAISLRLSSGTRTVIGSSSLLPARAVIGPSISPPSPRCFYTLTPKSIPKVLVWQGSGILHSLKGSALFLRKATGTVATQPLSSQTQEADMEAPKEIFLADYKVPDYFFDTVDLKFVLGDDKTIVLAKTVVQPRIEGIDQPLILNGSDLKLISMKVNGKQVEKGGFQLTPRSLTLVSPPTSVFTLEIETEIYPQHNTSLEGLYKSSGNFCTQCEAEGFRKITFYQDRPDILAKFTTRVEADKTLFPVLLSNGNLIEQGDLKDGRHYAVWEDPFKKPCYLFALVAGQLVSRNDTFITRSGRQVSLRIWTPADDIPKTAHAMYSLKAAMKWDEDVFGLEYDLDLFNIVAVPDFNMGAMENKSLNIFNSRLVLASPQTATDADYAAILGVIGHEYFHNWTGNRVTCRDWFQLSLKEGLTVFRDQEFSSDMGSRAVKRIGDVVKLRNYQFPQDAGPMAHPVRPHSYIKMDNFYTVTVYEKGAEVVRMYKTMLGQSGFRKGMDLYFQRHDGQAVTCEVSDLLSGESFMNSKACSSIQQLQDCRKCTSPRARKEDELLETDLLESTVNLVENREDEWGISGTSKSVGDQSVLVHKVQQKELSGDLGRYKDIKSHVRRSKFQRLYGAILSADNDEKIQNIISKVGDESVIKFCNAVLKSLEREDEDKALSLFHLMRQSGKARGNLPAYNIAFRVLSRRENWSAVEILLEEICLDPGCVLNSQIFNTLIYVCSKKGLVQWGAKWFHKMVEEGVQPTDATYGMLMILYQKAGNLHEAEFTFEHMKSSGIHCYGAYSAMITIYNRLNLYEKAGVVIDLMNEKQVSPNKENWLVQLNTDSQQGKLQAAEKVMHLMEESGLPPNIIVFNSLITGYGKVGLLKQAMGLFQNLQNVGLRPDEATYRSMIEGCGKAGRLKEALWYYNEMKTNGFHPSSLNLKTIINLLAKFNDEDGAVQILSDMIDMGCEYASIIQILVQAYERADRLHKVPSILKASLHERGQLGETASAILVLAYARNGMLAEALEFLEEIPGADTTFNEGLYHVLICSFKEVGNCEGAAQIFSKMAKGSVYPNLQITCTMIDVYNTMGLFTKAQDLYFQLKSSNIKLDMVTYSVVVKMYLNANLPNNAAQVLEMMENQNDIKPDSCLFHYMLRVYHQCKMPDKAAEVYYRILRAKLKWDGAMYNCIINCCGRALPIDETSKIFDDMLKSGILPNTITFNVMIDIYGKSGLLTKAYEVLRIARKQGLSDIISYNTLISAYGKWKDYAGMEETFHEIQRGGLVVSLEAFNSMLDAYGKSGQLKEFGNVLERMSRAGCYFDLYTYNIMINVYGKNGLIEEITDLIIRLKKEGLEPNICTYNTLIGAYGVAGMPDEAVRVVKEMQNAEIQPDRITYINLIAAFERSDNFLEAARWSLWMKQAGMVK